MNKCNKCQLIMNDDYTLLCEECFFEEFEKQTGLKPEWRFNEKTKEYEHGYMGIGFKK